MKNLIFMMLFFSSPWAYSADIKVSAGLNIYRFDYKENLPFRHDIQRQLKSTESATVVAPFVKAKLSHPSLGRNYFTGEFEGAPANSHFDGTTLDGDPVTDTNMHLFLRGEADFYFELMPSMYGYLGLGYFYWNRYLSGGAGYREIYTWGYFPIGIRYEIPLAEKFLWSLDVSYRMMFGGKILIIFSETVVNGDDSELDLGNRSGFKLQSPFEMILNPRMNLFFSPWYESSEIGESNFEYNQTVDSFIQEPSSRTIQMGFAAGLTYQF